MKKEKIFLGFGLFTILGFITGCSTPCNTLPANQNPVIIGGYTKLISFNYLIDTNINNNDSRIKTLELVASQNPSAKIIIKYSDKAGLLFSKNLTEIFKSDGYKSVMIGYKSNVPYTVDAYINFKPLDKSVSSFSNERESMISIYSNIESGSEVNNTVIIKE